MKLLKQQKGVILVVALIMLLVMTGVGVTMISGSTLQERMAGNARQQSVARANAESALREAEFFLAGLNITNLDSFIAQFSDTNRPQNALNKGLFTDLPDNYVLGSLGAFNPIPSGTDDLGKEIKNPASWVSTNGTNQNRAVSVSSKPKTSPTAARFVIEFIGNWSPTTRQEINVNDSVLSVDESYAFRITAIGYGANDNISSIVQSVYTTGQGVQ